MSVSELELWAGVECTVNRVGEKFFDQVERTGHAARLQDIERLAELGVRAVRYPILWERSARDGLEGFDFSWADPRMQRLRELGIRVIVGLVHHGSGPRGTSLLEDSFAVGLSRFARRVAERYPWVEDYTPVNEPLTTARFSALYGHWYPHARSTQAFLRALMVQSRATVMAMREIRKVNPRARLIQTEDFGCVSSTRKLRYQAEFENQRKWLSLDLLMGRVTPDHPLHDFLLCHDVPGHELQQLALEPCAPDLLGVNYYVTSDRFLDERVSWYPEPCIGSNGRDRYADVEAVRVHGKGIVGHRDVLLSAWSRYHTPLAVTEVHLGCTPEEQVRWLGDAWSGAHEAKRAGAEVRAVTLWSVFGAYDWDSLVTQARGHYEPGAFDVRDPTPRATALARIAAEFGRSGVCSDPLLAAPGWWRCSKRLCYPPEGSTRTVCEVDPVTHTRPVLITGGGGRLAEVFRRACEQRGIAVKCFSRTQLDIADPRAVSRVLAESEPWLVVNAAGVSWSRAAVDDTAICFRDNVDGAKTLAQACKRMGTRLVTFSSAFVFDGSKREPYVETDTPNPCCVLGSSHASAERIVSEIYPEALIVRPGTLFDTTAGTDRIWTALCRLANGEAIAASGESYWSLAYAPELAQRCLDLAMAHQNGIVHLAHHPSSSVYDFMRKLAEALGVPTANLVPTNREQCRIWSRLPASTTIASSRVASLSTLDACMERLRDEMAQVVPSMKLKWRAA